MQLRSAGDSHSGLRCTTSQVLRYALNPALARCLGADAHAAPAVVERVEQWLPQWRAIAAEHADPMARAISGGHAADRVGWAFAAGYQAALRALVPDLPDDTIAALCVTEERGNRPRDIATTITTLPDGSVSISGAKRWTTLGPDSALLLVVGRVAEGSAGGRPRLSVARVPSATPGLTLVAMAPTRFVPEVPHAAVRLDDVRLPADALLDGDGYAAVVKPFRTIEDLHVSAAVLAYLLREARARGWPAAFRERIVATLVALTALSTERASAAATHVALEGALQWAHELYAEAGGLWSAAVGDVAAARWQRDAALFGVAGTARAARARRAWERLAQASKGGGDDDE
jgi:acyl-CoA dehydrogenase